MFVAMEENSAECNGVAECIVLFLRPIHYWLWFLNGICREQDKYKTALSFDSLNKKKGVLGQFGLEFLYRKTSKQHLGGQILFFFRLLAGLLFMVTLSARQVKH